HGRLRLIASTDGREGSVTVHQDVSVYAAILDPGTALAHTLAAGRHAWVQVARGAVEVNGRRLGPGDGAGVSAEPALAIAGAAPAEILLFDLA
ncbi:MAG: pirin family protein, partial [Candidatus Rokubacteria bacterium]|nr:pirin family protein [Candidatus Rokubacteria bacterium]